MRLESFDELHGPRLRRTSDRATGKRGPQEPRDGNVVPEAPPDDAFQMMHIRERTKPPEGWHMDAAKLADLAEVVPLQVADTHVLRSVLLARGGFLRVSLVLRSRSPPGSVPLDRTGFDIPAPDLEEPLGTRRQEPVISRLEESSERRWRAPPKALVRGGRGPSDRKRDAMRQVDLEDLALDDRPFRFLDRVDVVLGGERVDRSRVGRHGEVVRNRRGVVFDSGPPGDHQSLPPHPVGGGDARIHPENDVRGLEGLPVLIRPL